ncbi:hypothetical protein [Labedaea rhizosphaerae]|uniref:Uncharacterized protein n=1 Tax=Labedaea rhizosphaerae TaxID=598644 RepID=A0A4R6SJ46_LABRH|nr:hypothetical protein [Labedaea rhizosphaerae]TDQ01028.1 hypothetical protein EV186_102895 [Labedaea rhizosphaerae]
MPGLGATPATILTGSMTLAWQELPLRAGAVELLAEFYARAEVDPGEDLTARRVGLRETPQGKAVRLRTRQAAMTPRPQMVAITQCFAPFPGTDWLAVLTVTTPDLALDGILAQLTDQMIDSLEFTGVRSELRASSAPSAGSSR